MTKEKKRLGSEREMANAHFHFVGQGRKRPRLIHKKKREGCLMGNWLEEESVRLPTSQIFRLLRWTEIWQLCEILDELRFDNFVKSQMNWDLKVDKTRKTALRHNFACLCNLGWNTWKCIFSIAVGILFLPSPYSQIVNNETAMLSILFQKIQAPRLPCMKILCFVSWNISWVSALVGGGAAE